MAYALPGTDNGAEDAGLSCQSWAVLIPQLFEWRRMSASALIPQQLPQPFLLKIKITIKCNAMRLIAEPFSRLARCGQNCTVFGDFGVWLVKMARKKPAQIWWEFADFDHLREFAGHFTSQVHLPFLMTMCQFARITSQTHLPIPVPPLFPLAALFSYSSRTATSASSTAPVPG